MTPEQRERLEDLKARQGQPVRQENPDVPPHLRHAHYATDRGPEPCACPSSCTYCAGAE